MRHRPQPTDYAVDIVHLAYRVRDYADQLEKCFALLKAFLFLILYTSVKYHHFFKVSMRLSLIGSWVFILSVYGWHSHQWCHNVKLKHSFKWVPYLPVHSTSYIINNTSNDVRISRVCMYIMNPIFSSLFRIKTFSIRTRGQNLNTAAIWPNNRQLTILFYHESTSKV